jgi:hypothetical protein
VQFDQLEAGGAQPGELILCCVRLVVIRIPKHVSLDLLIAARAAVRVLDADGVGHHLLVEQPLVEQPGERLADQHEVEVYEHRAQLQQAVELGEQPALALC